MPISNRVIVWGVVGAVVAGASLFSWHNIVSQSCVNVVIDYGVLKDAPKTEKCVTVNGKTNALELLGDMGVNIDGTEKYGKAIACRVDGLPSATKPIGIKDHEDYIETCKDMPAEFAYWAVLVKRAQVVPNPLDVQANWNWAETGIADITLEAGDSLGLVFADNSNVTFPK